MPSKIKILIVVKSIDGGTGTFVLNLLKIKRILNNVEIKTLVLEKPSFRRIKSTKDIGFVRRREFYPDSYRFSLSIVSSFIKEIYWLKKELTKFSPEIVLGVDIHANLLIMLNKLIFYPHLKTILTTHIDLGKTLEDKSETLLYKFLKIVIRFFYERSDALVGVSRGLSLKFKKDFSIRKKILTIYNGIAATPSQKRISPSRNLRIITIARLVEQKDHLNLIEAVNLLSKELRSVHFQIVSDGPLKKMLINKVKSLKLSKKVTFLGWVKNITPYLRNADIFVLSSKREGFGYSLVEAMSQGLPVVSTDTPFGPAEILDKGKYGLLVPMGNSKKLKEAILALAKDKKKYAYFSKMSLQRSLYFSLETMLTGYKNLIVKIYQP